VDSKKEFARKQIIYSRLFAFLYLFALFSQKKILNGTSGRTKEEYQNVLVAVFHFYCSINLGNCLSMGISNHDYPLRLYLLCEGDGYHVIEY